MSDQRSSGAANQAVSFLTARDILAVLFRHPVAMTITFLGILGGVALSGVWKPQYQAQMKILVLRQRADALVSSSANAPVPEPQVTEEELNSEIELLNSHELLAQVVRSTHLEGQRHWWTGDREVRVATAVRQLSKNLKIDPVRKSHIIMIRYAAHDPKRAAAVLTALGVAYKAKHAEVHWPPGEYQFFDEQTEQYQHSLQQAQQQLLAFSRKSGVVSAQMERDYALQRADEFEAKSRQAQASAAETQERIRGLEAQLASLSPRLTTAARTADNPGLLERLKNTLLDLELKRTALLTKYDPGYPLVQEVDKQIEETREAIRAEAKDPVREESTDTNPTYVWGSEELTKSRAELKGLEAERATSAGIAIRYREAAYRLDADRVIQQDLLRNAKIQEDGYLLYVHKREQAGISDALDQQHILNVVIAEEPIAPALPRRSPIGISLLTLLFAFTGGLSSAFLVDFIDPTFRTPDEVARYLDSPVLAALPKP